METGGRKDAVAVAKIITEINCVFFGIKMDKNACQDLFL